MRDLVEIEVFAPLKLPITPGPVEVILREARALIAEPRRWAAHVAYGPTQFCVMGAMSSARKDGHTGYAVWARAHHKFKAAANCEKIADWNDASGRTHAKILSGFDRAIALAHSEGA